MPFHARLPYCGEIVDRAESHKADIPFTMIDVRF
jgi:hypothetical protein